jgi:hypothetical protein
VETWQLEQNDWKEVNELQNLPSALGVLIVYSKSFPINSIFIDFRLVVDPEKFEWKALEAHSTIQLIFALHRL